MSNSFRTNTQFILIANRFIQSLLEAMYFLLVFIFCKELNATPLQITLLISAKPIVALIAFYGGSFIKDQHNKLKPFLITISILGCLPCFLFPFIESPWYYVLGYAIFMTSVKASIPAWAEILKTNLNLEDRGKVFAKAATVNYLITVFVPVVVAPFLDYNPHIWKWLFVVTAAFQLLNFIIIPYLRLKPSVQTTDDSSKLMSLHSVFINPLKEAKRLIINDYNYRSFLIMFVLGGAGLVALQPILPVFFKENLLLSYSQMTLATCFCKGIAFALTSSTWAKWMGQHSIYRVNLYINLLSCTFILFILATNLNIYWIYLAYIMYGAMQSGYEISWNLSGPIFSKEKDSVIFTSVNLLVLGIRGCIFPFLGELLFLNSNANVVFIYAECACLIGLIYTFLLDKKISNQKSLYNRAVL